MLNAATKDEEKIMLLKAIANMGSIKSLGMIQDRLQDSETLPVRVHAVWALKNMGFQNKLKVCTSKL